MAFFDFVYFYFLGEFVCLFPVFRLPSRATVTFRVVRCERECVSEHSNEREASGETSPASFVCLCVCVFAYTAYLISHELGYRTLCALLLFSVEFYSSR